MAENRRFYYTGSEKGLLAHDVKTIISNSGLFRPHAVSIGK
jgi:hypothetical protein